MKASDSAEARQQLRDYLDDEAPPLLVAETITRLMENDLEAVSQVMLAWANDQLEGSLHAIPFSDFLFHAVKKAQLLEESGCLEMSTHRRAVAGLGNRLLEFCPEDERADFLEKLNRVFESSVVGRTVDFIHRAEDSDQHGRDGPLTGAYGAREERGASLDIRSARGRGLDSGPIRSSGDHNADVNRARMLAQRSRDSRLAGAIDHQQVRLGLRRFSMLLDRLETLKDEISDPDNLVQATELVSEAAQEARDAEELRAYFDRLKAIGLDNLRTDLLFQKLMERLPDWQLPDAEKPMPAPLKGIQNIVESASSREEQGRYLAEIFSSAVAYLNEGALNRAQAVLDLADRLLKQSVLDDDVKRSIRSAAELRVDPEHFLRLAAQPECHPQLRRILQFFTSYRLNRLFKRLLVEQDRKSRYVILQMLLVYGQEARDKASELLQVSVLRRDGGMPWYFQRNLIHLLRQIEMPRESGHARELSDVISVTRETQNHPVLREAFAYFGTVKDPKAEKALVHNLIALQRRVADRALPRNDRAEAIRMRALALGQLLHHESPRARKIVLDQILSPPDWTATQDKLMDRLGTSDLSSDNETLERILVFTRAMVHEDLSITGVRNLNNDQRIRAAIAGLRALRSTPRPEVRDFLNELLQHGHFEHVESAAREARHSLDRIDAQSRSDEAEVLNGDIGVFGLPGLLVTLEQNAASGHLILQGSQDDLQAVLELRGGEFATCHAGNLEGEDAFFSLLQRPFAARFRFTSMEALGPTLPTRNLTALVLEASRRHDDFKRCQSMVGDYALIEINENGRPSSPDYEPDGELVRELWGLLSTCPTAIECEQLLAAEPFRVRRLLATWLSEGAITISRRAHL